MAHESFKMGQKPSSAANTDLTRMTRLYTANVTSNSYAAIVPLVIASEPSVDGAGTFYVPPSGGNSYVNFIFFGTDAANETAEAQVWMWKPGPLSFIPIHICTAGITLGAKTGVAACDVLNTEYFADTIAITANSAAASAQAISMAGDTVASLRLDGEGGWYGTCLLRVGDSGPSAGINGLVWTS